MKTAEEYFLQRDISEHDLEKLAFIESPSPQVITQHRKMLRCNKAFAELFGYDTTALENELIRMLYPNSMDYQQVGERSRKALEKNSYYEDERFMQHSNQEIFWARAKGITLTPEDPFALMVWSFERIRHNETKAIELTPREREIAGYIVNGLTCKETGQALGISHRTVEVHRGRLMKKLDAKNTAELVSKIVMVEHKR